MDTTQNWRTFLQTELNHRRTRNPNYSLRSFAKQLQVSPTQMSMLLSGKRKVKAKTAIHLAEMMGLTSVEVFSLLENEASTRLKPTPSNIHILNVDEFGPIASWQYYAILGLTSLSQNVAEPKWIADKLNITEKLAADCFNDLIRLGHIEVKNGQFKQVSQDMRTTDDVPVTAIRRYHKQSMQLAAQKIDTVDVQLREYTSMTIPINLKKIHVAKKLIREFKETFSQEMSRGKKTDVYDLCIQFFPLSETK